METSTPVPNNSEMGPPLASFPVHKREGGCGLGTRLGPPLASFPVHKRERGVCGLGTRLGPPLAQYHPSTSSSPGLISLALLPSARAFFFSIIASLPVALGRSSSSTWGQRSNKGRSEVKEGLYVTHAKSIRSLLKNCLQTYQFIVFSELPSVSLELCSAGFSSLLSFEWLLIWPTRTLYA